MIQIEALNNESLTRLAAILKLHGYLLHGIKGNQMWVERCGWIPKDEEEHKLKAEDTPA